MKQRMGKKKYFKGNIMDMIVPWHTIVISLYFLIQKRNSKVDSYQQLLLTIYLFNPKRDSFIGESGKRLR